MNNLYTFVHSNIYTYLSPGIIFIFIPLILLYLIYTLNKNIKKNKPHFTIKSIISGILLLVSLLILMLFTYYAFTERQINFMLIASIAPPILGNIIVSAFIKDNKKQNNNDSSELEKQGVFILSSTMVFIIFVFLHIEKMSKYSIFIYLSVAVTFMILMLVMIGSATKKNKFPSRGTVMFFSKEIDSPDFKGGFFLIRVIYILALVGFIIFNYNDEPKYKTIELCYSKSKYSLLSTDIKDKYGSLEVSRNKENNTILIRGEKDTIDSLILSDCNKSIK